MSWNEIVGVSTRGRRVAPQHLARGERVGEQLPAALEVEALGVVLLALPAGADTEVEPAARHHVERGGLLGEQHGRA